uniref:E3 ubiquitin-protein ligase tom1 n=1 Tax=Sphaerodactylus townsendi TaxID=933632 RepID=A0ACB8FN79_9SAUR
MEICDIINETEEGPKDAFRAIKKRIVGNKNFREVMLALTVLETCVKNCGHRFHVLVSSQDFVEGVLVRTILPKNNPPTIVHDKVLTLIQSWADAFRSSPDLTGVVAVYEDLRRKGLEFPMTDLDMLSPIHTPQRTVYTSDSPSGQNSPAVDSSQTVESILHPVSLPVAPGASAEAPIVPTPEQIGKLRSELEVVNGNVKVMSEMLTELVPGQTETSDLELLQELNRTCKAMQQRVLELIPRILNEQLTEELLIVNDNLNNVFLRHERFERLRSGQPTKQHNNTENASSLIDMVPSVTPAGNESEAPNSLSTQLAGMNSRFWQLAVVVALCFFLDAIVHSEGPSQKTKRFFEKFEGKKLGSRPVVVGNDFPLIIRVKCMKTSLWPPKDSAGAPLDARQQNTGALEPEAPISDWMMQQGMIPVSQGALMEDIEQWLGTDKAEDSKGVTSEEFDKFLEERAKVADRLPLLSNPLSWSLQIQLASTSSDPHRKKEKEDDTMFAL